MAKTQSKKNPPGLKPGGFFAWYDPKKPTGSYPLA